MRNDRGVFSYLVEHFFRRFFDNDTMQAEGDTQTSVVRAIAIVAVPGLMFAFWLQNQYPQRTIVGIDRGPVLLRDVLVCGDGNGGDL